MSAICGEHGKELICPECESEENGGLDTPYELARLVEACRQLITAAGYDAGNVPKARAPWKVLCNAINYYGEKGI
jgi:hypothetical protein